MKERLVEREKEREREREREKTKERERERVCVCMHVMHIPTYVTSITFATLMKGSPVSGRGMSNTRFTVSPANFNNITNGSKNAGTWYPTPAVTSQHHTTKQNTTPTHITQTRKHNTTKHPNISMQHLLKEVTCILV